MAALSASCPKSSQQVQLLLTSLKRSLSRPFQQLPGIIATFAAEAVYVLMAPGSAMYSPVNKLLLKQPALNIEVSGWEVIPAPESYANSEDLPSCQCPQRCFM